MARPAKTTMPAGNALGCKARKRFFFEKKKPSAVSGNKLLLLGAVAFTRLIRAHAASGKP
jgi:hypothetical protein